MSTTPSPRITEVFISVGHNLTTEDESFVQAIKAYLSSQGIVPLTIERRAQQISDPIETIRNVIRKSSGTIVIAIERYRANEVFEFPKGSAMRILSARKTTTVWNQIEAAMTLQSQRPLLIFCEEGLTHEGVIDPAIYPVITFATTDASKELPLHIREALSEWCKWL